MFYRAIEGTYTKTRRLAYLSAIVAVLEHHGLSEQQLLLRLVDWNIRNQEWLRNYWVQTGEITSTHRNSAGDRYIQLSVSLGLVSPIAGLYRNTRVGLVLLSLLENQQRSRSGPFYLTRAERLLYLHRILELDKDLTLTVVDYILNHPGVVLAEIQQGFKDAFLARLQAKLLVSREVQDVAIQQSLLDRRREVENWKRAERYAEHIVPPRLNWLLDLSLVDAGLFKRHIYKFTEDGLLFCKSLPNLGQTNFHDLDSDWLGHQFWRSAAQLIIGYSTTDWSDINRDQRQGLLRKYLPDTFRTFQYTTLPKVSLTQAILYLSTRFVLEERIVVGPKELIQWLSQSEPIDGRRYEVRFSARENESYLTVTHD